MAELSPEIILGDAGRWRRPDTLHIATHDLGQLAEVVSFMPRLNQRQEAAARSQAMLDLTRFTLRIRGITKSTFAHPSNSRVHALLWGMKDVIDRDEPIKYLPTNVEPLDLWNDLTARGIARTIVREDRIEQIARSEETKPLIQDFDLFLRGEPSRYDPGISA
jgi:hypothetical protein